MFMSSQASARSLMRIAATLIAALFLAPALWAQTLTTKGTDFWVAFTANYTRTPTLRLFISSEFAANVTVEIPGLSFTQSITTTPNSTSTIVIPSAAELITDDVVGDLGIHVTSDQNVSVYGINDRPASTDAFLGIPTASLGTQYMALSYNALGGFNGTLAVVATDDNTAVTITPSVNNNAGTRLAGVPYTVNLNRGQTYQFLGTSSADITGSTVSATKPVAVYSGASCVNIPVGYVACDMLVEQLTPLDTWGQSFLTYPLKGRNGDTIRILAAENATEVKINGAVVATLAQGASYETILNVGAFIETSGPALVAQYANSLSYDNTTGDPFMAYVPPTELFINDYTVATADEVGGTRFAFNHINVIVPTDPVTLGPITVQMNGAAIPAASYTQIGTTGFYAAQVDVTPGSYHFTSPAGISVLVYGFTDYDSYGYPGGLGLARVTQIADIQISPALDVTRPINQQFCLNATVTNSLGQPVPSVRVDFTIAGMHPGLTSAFTNASGVATYCYTGTLVGLDTITAAAGTVSATSRVNWVVAEAAVAVPVPTMTQNTLLLLTLFMLWIAMTRGGLLRRIR